MLFATNGVGMGSRYHFYLRVLISDYVFVNIIDEMIANLNNISMDELKRDWK